MTEIYNLFAMVHSAPILPTSSEFPITDIHTKLQYSFKFILTKAITRKRPSPKVHSNNSNEWYTRDCRLAKKALVTALKTKTPLEVHAKGQASAINVRYEKIKIRHKKISLTPGQMACSFDEKNLVREERLTRSLQRQLYEQHNGPRGNSLPKKPMVFTCGTDFPDVQASVINVRCEKIKIRHKKISLTPGQMACSFDEKHLVREEGSTRSSQTITNKLYLKTQICKTHNDTRANSLSRKPMAFISSTDFPDVQDLTIFTAVLNEDHKRGARLLTFTVSLCCHVSSRLKFNCEEALSNSYDGDHFVTRLNVTEKQALAEALLFHNIKPCDEAINITRVVESLILGLYLD
ncbi:hypothetical protein NDU88_004290 [Pleurodeles waltl]|uniref:Uncharacterized protein n=1 Tax=Pleurodeles waltl TaxID=8319 RepID=A0AAV7PFK9_PLEWA|nr:hypothetical protein NDU88_004290 [Pleurodeles waltl]